MAVASLRGTPTTDGKGLGGDPILAVPASTVAGDLLVAIMGSTGGTFSTPAGWALHANAISTQAPLFTRTATSGDVVGGVTYTFVCSGVGNQGAIMIPVKDWGSVDAVVGLLSGSGSMVIPQLTSGGANRDLLQIVIRLAASTFTGPGPPPTERFESTIPTANWGVVVADETVNAGATGTRTWVPSNNAGAIFGYMLAIAPLAPKHGSASGNPTSSATVTGSKSPAGTVSGGSTSSASVTGSRASSGSLSGAVASSGSATGSIPNGGAVSASVTHSGSAAGSMSPAGTVAAAVTTSGTVTGSVRHAGTVAGSVASSGSVTGDNNQTNAAYGAVASAGSASGSIEVSGSASGSVTSSGAAAGSITRHGSIAPISVTHSGSAGGTARHYGAASASVTTSGVAIGRTQAAGTVSASVTTSGAAVGSTRHYGTVGGSVVSSARVRGRSRPPRQHRATIVETSRNHTIAEHQRTSSAVGRPRKTTVMEGTG